MPADIPIDVEVAILAAAERNNVPPNLALRLAWVESRYVPTAVSSAGARGLFQLMPETGRAYGLETEADFFNIEKNSNAGLAHLRYLYKRYGKWWLALAAYNRGEGWLRRNPDYRKWPQRLRQYVVDVFGQIPGGSAIPKLETVAVPGRR